MGFNCLEGTEPQRGDSLLFTTKFLEVPVIHLELTLASPSGLELETPGLRIQGFNQFIIRYWALKKDFKKFKVIFYHSEYVSLS